MAVINLPEADFFINGRSGASRVVGNDWENDEVAQRVARYTLPIPAQGAQEIKCTFHTTGKSDGEHIPIRYYIGTDPESHKAANGSYVYTGELILADDWLTFTCDAKMLLLPGKTYYLWLFPGSDTYGHYYWHREGYTNTMETIGAAGLGKVKCGGKIRKGRLWVVRNGKFRMCLGHVIKDEAFHIAGSS